MKLRVAGAQAPVGHPSGTTMAGLTNTLLCKVAVAEHVLETKVNV